MAGDPPTLLRQPQDRSVIVGRDVIFVVAVTGDLPFTYEWTFNGLRVGTNGPSYARNQCQLVDSGARVEVTVTNERGSVKSAIAALNVRWAGTNFYIAVNGSTNNTGLSMDSPWPLRQGMARIGPSNTVNLLPGTYPTIRIREHGTTLKSLTRWGAKISGTPYTHGIHTLDGISDVLVEGIHVKAAHVDGIKLGGNNSTVRDCWIQNAGRAHPFGITNVSGLFSGQGISGHNLYGTVVEYNLIEKCGLELTQDHGMYLSGTNIIIRGNVVRHNIGWGIQIYDSYGDNANVLVHNNLSYGNGLGPMTVWSRGQDTNYIIHNTLIGHEYGLIAAGGRLVVANNIIMGGPLWHPAFVAIDGAVVEGGFNLFNKNGGDLDHRFATDFQRADPGFVDPSSGLYWLKSTSPARGAAGPWGALKHTDFFGAAESGSGSTDIGAYAFEPALEEDIRVLDPSLEVSDYWLRLEPLDPTKGSISGYVFADANANGLRDLDELPLSGWTVILSGASSRSMITAVNGKFSFANLPPGSYLVAGVTQSGWRQTVPMTGDLPIILQAGNALTNLAFGNLHCPIEELRIRTVRCEANQVIVEFSSPLSSVSGGSAADYRFVPPLDIRSVDSSADGRTFALRVVALDAEATYTLTTSVLLDACEQERFVPPVKFSCNHVVLSTIQAGPGTFSLQWVRPGILQESMSVAGPWKDVSSHGFVTLPSLNAHGFFRLIELK